MTALNDSCKGPIPNDRGDLGSESVEAALSDLARTTEDIITLEELQQLLLSGRRLQMKYGVDPTAPELH